MCGLTGFFGVPDRQGLAETARQMANAIVHRGPDGAGAWADDAAGLALGHRRLAIIDLSAAGHQPMHSAGGRWVIAFNGEIYNHMALRADLQAAQAAPGWRGHSDTETLLAAIEHWGVEATLQRCVGMFAIALWDRKNRSLTLARDRFGEKPLYYGWTGSGPGRALVFGSELKALKAYPGFDAPICREALTQYLRFMYVPAPRSIYQGVFKLEPGCLLTVRDAPPADAPLQPLRPGQSHGTLAMCRWWSLSHAVECGADQLIDDETVAVQTLEDRLADSVRLQSLADVPLGAFLSGGVDSSAIVALMQRQAARPVQTFTIGFEEAGYDESPHAAAVARHLGTEHHEMRVTARMAQELIPKLPWMYDEPFADSSQIPTHLVCQAARQQVTVALSGDAGDELFGGYNRHFWAPRLWAKVGGWPYPLRQGLSQALAALPTTGWDALAKPLGVVRPGEKLHKLARSLNKVRTVDNLYGNLIAAWPEPEDLVLDAQGLHLTSEPATQHGSLPAAVVDNPALRIMYLDTTSYLPDDILCKVDRAAMATSLETRVPFLDHRVVELAWRLPLHMKVRGSTGKWALRQVLYKYVPSELIERPKAGFALPTGQWLRGPLRAWAEDLLAEPRLRAEGYLRPEPIRQAWTQHLRGSQDNSSRLWAVLMFQAWLASLAVNSAARPT